MSSGSDRGTHLKLGAIAGGLIGLGLCGWLLASYGLVRILEVMARAGAPGILAIVAFHLPQMLFSALGWQAIAGADPPRLRLRTYLLLRWVREAVNNLLPLAQIGGEFVAARLLQRRGVLLAPAIAGTTADLTLEMATQVLFTLSGLLLLRQIAADGDTAVLVRGLWVATLSVAALFVALRLGLAALVERGLLRLGRSFGWPATAQVGGLHEALMRCYRAPGRVALAALWHLLSWLLGGVEVCLVLHFLGHDVGLATGMIVESLGQAAKSIGFAVPGAVGVQEGGYVVVCRMLGISPELALALSLMKRLREVLLGLPGLILWHRTEAQAASAPTASISGGLR